MHPMLDVRQRLSPANRVEGLSRREVETLQRSVGLLDAGQFDAAARVLETAIAVAPGHPELIRIKGVIRYRGHAFAEAVALFRQTLSVWPQDALTLGNLGSVLADSGEADAAIATFRAAVRAAPTLAAAWFNLGKQLEANAELEAAADALRRAIHCSPEHVSARILYGETLNALGDAGAAAQFRAALNIQPHASRAWFGLVNLKTERLSDAETQTLGRTFERTNASSNDRVLLGFALGKALEDQRRYAQAFRVFSEANAAKRATMPWDAKAHSAHVAAMAQALAGTHAQAKDTCLGREVIFIVGLPRSGSTLIEQILASHPDVEGASELPDLEQVLAEESQQRGIPFPQWIATATSVDWERLGRNYLERTRRWRTRRPRFTDKQPENWRFAGAALAMLPNARVIDCRRDPVETCWSCFKQLFGSGRLPATYDLLDLAAYSVDRDALCDLVRTRHPDRFRALSYEALIANFETETRNLLAFCDLPFDEATLRFQETIRPIRTASAAQVRQPLRDDTALTSHYGTLLAPLREALRNGPQQRTLEKHAGKDPRIS